MNGILIPNDNFDFTKIHLSDPVPLPHERVFAKILYGDTDNNLLIQAPTCKMKDGIKSIGNKKFTDLLFTNYNSNYIEWTANLEEHLTTYLYEKKSHWLKPAPGSSSDIEVDLESLQKEFIAPMKPYKKNHIMRVDIIGGTRGIKTDGLQVYDQNESPMRIEDVKPESNIICVLEIIGITFSVKLNIKIEIAVKQIMVLGPAGGLQNCMIKPINNTMVQEVTVDTKKADIIIDGDGEDAGNNYVSDNNIEIDTIELNVANSEDTIASASIEDLVTVVQQDNDGNLVEMEEVVKIEGGDDDSQLKLKKRSEFYIDIYREAYRKAKETRMASLEAYMAARDIKYSYSLGELIDPEEDIEKLNETLPYLG
jgi:hypothetical protein